MNTLAINTGRVLAFAVLLVFAIVPYGYLFDFATRVAPVPHSQASRLIILFAEVLFPALVVAALAAYPLAWIFRRRASLAGFVLILPTAAFIIAGTRQDAGALEVSFAWIQVVLYAALVVGTTTLVCSRRAP